MSTVNIPEEILDDHRLSFGAFKVYCKLLQFYDVQGITLQEIKDTTTLGDKWWGTYIDELKSKGYIVNKYIFNHKGVKIDSTYTIKTEVPKKGSVTMICYFLKRDGSLERVEIDSLLIPKTRILKKDYEFFNMHEKYVEYRIGIILGADEDIESIEEIEETEEDVKQVDEKQSEN